MKLVRLFKMLLETFLGGCSDKMLISGRASSPIQMINLQELSLDRRDPQCGFHTGFQYPLPVWRMTGIQITGMIPISLIVLELTKTYPKQLPITSALCGASFSYLMKAHYNVPSSMCLQ